MIFSFVNFRSQSWLFVRLRLGKYYPLTILTYVIVTDYYNSRMRLRTSWSWESWMACKLFEVIILLSFEDHRTIITYEWSCWMIIKESKPVVSGAILLCLEDRQMRQSKYLRNHPGGYSDISRVFIKFYIVGYI